ncbi:prepilin-type N-terminal cleavage/methylation domain-containing protein [Desulfonatronum thiosulfatophilum]|uniref:Prepilin-type N-terminal cleavage/methylation domain-containing protein n=1 Tax=Desulfonatronum thiosulfatophilum TaxID=617002 RepID=A0A1G6CN03_9BACT|nr:prepilin-type N-terminal cleavage/methylation domain-containing protein [Desulfonatronum thiosulfatophilum]SDB34269.1 prepilin-type N-terminal cleavage/methylation domain-containing protein [Desulfonatronum thiosulfatophilum]
MKENRLLLKHRSSKGFTLLEVVVVLILLGILAAVAIARVGNHGADERAAADKLKVHLRYAQGMAMNSDISWGVSGDGTSYFLFDDVNDPEGNKRFFPGEDAVDVDNSHASFYVHFDSWGRPNDISSAITTPMSISLNTQTITITPETGFIP